MLLSLSAEAEPVLFPGDVVFNSRLLLKVGLRALEVEEEEEDEDEEDDDDDGGGDIAR